MTTPAAEAQGRGLEVEVGAESDERISAPASLDEAWAEAEAALPEGWGFRIGTTVPIGRYRVFAYHLQKGEATGFGANGFTPAEALHALAMKLRERR